MPVWARQLPGPHFVVAGNPADPRQNGRVIEVIVRLSPEYRTRVPLLFVHGAWHGAWCWDRGFLDYFAERGWNSYALSLRNHGESLPRGSLRWTRHHHYVADIAEVAEGFDQPPVIIGHSMGGYLAQKYMEEHPVTAAVLVASVPVSGTLAASVRFARRHPIRFLELLVTMRLWPVIETPELVRELLLGEDATDAEVAEIHEALQDESFMTYLDMMGLARPRPGRTGAPVAVFAGDADRLFTVKEAIRTAQAYGVTAQVVPGLPHDMMLHRDWPALAAGISRFLETVT